MCMFDIDIIRALVQVKYVKDIVQALAGIVSVVQVRLLFVQSTSSSKIRDK